MKLRGEFEIALVVRRDGHDRAGAVADEDVVGNPDGDALAVDGVDGVAAGEDARFLLGKIGPVEVAFEGGLLTVIVDGGLLFGRGDAVDEGVFRREDHVGHAEEGVGPRGVDAEHVVAGDFGKAGFRSERFPVGEVLEMGSFRLHPVLGGGFFPHNPEIDFGSFAFADPVALEGLDRLGPVERFELVHQPIGVGGDAEHPLAEGNPLDRMAAPFAFAVDDFFIGEDGAEGRAPVDGGFVLIGEAVLVLITADGGFALSADFGGNRQFGNGSAFAGPFHAVGTGPLVVGVVPGVEELEKNPLGPAVVIGVGGGELAVPVVAEAEHFQLTAESADIFLGRDARMGAGFDGVLFGGKAEGVPAHGVEDVLAAHALVTADDVGRRVAFRVSDVEAVAGGVGEHIKHVQLAGCFRGRLVGSGERGVPVPVGLPLGFDAFGVVTRHGGLRV